MKIPLTHFLWILTAVSTCQAEPGWGMPPQSNMVYFTSVGDWDAYYCPDEELYLPDEADVQKILYHYQDDRLFSMQIVLRGDTISPSVWEFWNTLMTAQYGEGVRLSSGDMKWKTIEDSGWLVEIYLLTKGMVIVLNRSNMDERERR